MKDPYFDVQSEMGITKHAGGWKATKELAELCHIGNNKYVLVVGCGTGISANKLQKEYKCKLLGVDLHPRMIEQSKKEYPDMKFQVADAQKLPFKSNTFDAIISESVTAFPPGKLKAIKEYRRVLKPKGYVGLNETTWLSKPRKELTDYTVKAMGGVRPESGRNWENLIRKAGLKVVFAEPRKIKAFEQAVGEMQLNGLKNIKAFSRLIPYYFTKKEFRQAMNELVKHAVHVPKGFLKCLGYGLYVGQK
ncbi:MAG: class I SAM-dependent methyltransferase [Nanoarchaeota archaeon]|nr:class I SAM-dependent methyltransferase [Nanoarchaeota archaeon]